MFFFLDTLYYALYNIMCKEVMSVDIQLKRGILDILVLKSLMVEDSYGYNIVKSVSRYIEVSESTLYPILKRLESANFVTTYSVEYNGRLRKYYSITKLGQNRIVEFIEEFKVVIDVYKYIKGDEKL